MRAALRERCFVALIGLAAVAELWWSTSLRGLGMSYDSFAYAGTSDWIRSGRGWGYWLDPHLTAWPLGYPSLLAIIGALTGTDPRDAARLTQALLMCAVTFVVWRIACRVMHSPTWRIGATAAIVLCTRTTALDRLLLSETLSQLCTLLTVLALLRYFDRPTGARLVLIAAGASAAFLASYRGGLVAMAALVVVWLYAPADERRRAAARLVPAMSVVPVAYFLLNHLRAGTAYSPLAKSSLELVTIPELGAIAVGGWLFGGHGSTDPVGPGPLVGAIVFLVGVVALGGLIWHRRRTASRAAMVGAFGFLVLVGTCALRTVMFFDLNARTVFAAFAPIVLSAGATLEGWAPVRRRRLVSAAACVWAVLALVLGARAAVQFRPEGSGETSRANDVVRDELALPKVARLLDQCPTATDDPEVVWLVGKRELPLLHPADPVRPDCALLISTARRPVDPAQLTGYQLVLDGPGLRIYRRSP